MKISLRKKLIGLGKKLKKEMLKNKENYKNSTILIIIRQSMMSRALL